MCVRAERAFNAYLEGGCQVPIAGHATLIEGQLHIEGRVGSVDGAALAAEPQAEHLKGCKSWVSASARYV